MFIARKHIRKVAIGVALVGAVCLTFGGQPDAVGLSTDLFLLVAILFIGLLQDERFNRADAPAAVTADAT